MFDAADMDALRGAGRRARHEVPAARRAPLARDAADQARTLVELSSVNAVASYAARDGELDPSPLEHELRSQGATIWHPSVRDDELWWVRFDTGTAQRPGEFGIPEPMGSAQRSPDFDAVIVPVVAIDLDGNRTGHGHGYYDRALPRWPDAVRVGYAFDEQVVDSVPAREWDVTMDVVVTPTLVVRPTTPR